MRSTARPRAAAQLALYQATQDLVNAQTLWFLRNGAAISDLPGTIARHRTGVGMLKNALPDALPARRAALLKAEADRLADAGIPADLAADVAAPRYPGVGAADHRDRRGDQGSRIGRRAHLPRHRRALRISDLAAKAAAIPTPDYYDRLAVAQALNQLATAQTAFARDAIRARNGGGCDAWLTRQGDRLARVKAMLEEIAGEATLTVSRLLVAAGQLGDLAEATSAAPSASARRGRAGGRSKSAASGIPRPRRPARQPRS